MVLPRFRGQVRKECIRSVDTLSARPGPGRPKGSPNKRTKEAREIARKFATDKIYQKRLLQRLRAGKAGSMEPILWYYAYGKPKDEIEFKGSLAALTDDELNTYERLVEIIRRKSGNGD